MQGTNQAAAELRRQFEDLVGRLMASDQGQRLIEWYEGLGERERLALRVLGAFATVLLAYVLIVSPLLARGDKALRFLQDEQKMYAWLKSNESQAPQPASVACLQRLPEEAGGDGFYYAWLQKPHLLRTPSGTPPQP